MRDNAIMLLLVLCMKQVLAVTLSLYAPTVNAISTGVSPAQSTVHEAHSITLHYHTKTPASLIPSFLLQLVSSSSLTDTDR